MLSDTCHGSGCETYLVQINSFLLVDFQFLSINVLIALFIFISNNYLLKMQNAESKHTGQLHKKYKKETISLLIRTRGCIVVI